MIQLFGTTLSARGLWLLFTGSVLAGTVLLVQADQGFRKVDGVSKKEPLLVMPVDTGTIPGRQVASGFPSQPSPPHSLSPSRTSPSQQQAAPMELLPSAVSEERVDNVAEENSVVDGETLMFAIDEAEEILSGVMEQFSETLSSQPGVAFQFSSDAGTAILGVQGFTVTDIRTRQRFGLEVGDIIVAVNGYPVTGLDSAWRIFRNLFVKNRDLKQLQLKIFRGGAMVYKSYWVYWR